MDLRTMNWIGSKAIKSKEISDYCLIMSRAPQGSILGPLSFVLFINYLPEVLTKRQILMYADNTVTYFSASNSQVIADILTDEWHW